MGINYEVSFIHKILATGDMKGAVHSGLKPEQFVHDEPRAWFVWLLNYYRSPDHPGAVPTQEIFKEHFPRAAFPKKVPVPQLGELAKLARKDQLRAHLATIGTEIAAAGGGEDMDHMLLQAQDLHRKLMEVLYGSSSHGVCHLSAQEEVQAVFEEYEFRKAGGLSGVWWPWKEINDITGGIENGDLVTIYGRPKQLKSWIGLIIAAFYYHFSYSGRVLIYSCEMKKELFRRRAAAVLSRIHYGRFRRGQLTAEEEARFYETMRGLAEAETEACTNGHKKEMIIDYPGASACLVDLQAKIEAARPDFVIVDGVQHMADGTGGDKAEHKSQTKLSWDLKNRVAAHYDLPVLAIHQANRKKGEESLDDLAFSDSWGRDSDALIKLHKVYDPNHGQVCGLFFSGAREYNIAGAVINAKPAYDFSYIETLDSADHFSAYVKDTKEKNAENEETKRRVNRHRKNLAKREQKTFS